MAVLGADLNGVDDEHSLPIRGGLRPPGAVAVIGHDHEFQSGARRRGGDIVDRSGAIRAACVDVHDAAGASRNRGSNGQRLPGGRQRERHNRCCHEDDCGDDATQPCHARG